MLEEFSHVDYALCFSLVHCGTGEPDGSHCGRLVVGQVFVGHLDAVVVVIDAFVALLGEVS